MIREYDRKAPDREETETATFALGCFWGPEAQFGAMDGIVRTRVGYAGGDENRLRAEARPVVLPAVHLDGAFVDELRLAVEQLVVRRGL